MRRAPARTARVEQLAGVVDLGTRGGVHLEQVHEAPGIDVAQAPHSPQGFDDTPRSQLSDLAKIRAIVVLPTPRVPVKRKAWWMRPESSAFTSARRTWSCPTSSSKLRGRHLRARTR